METRTPGTNPEGRLGLRGLLFAGMALAFALGAFSWRSPAARADGGSGSSPGGTRPNLPSAWTGCSAGDNVVDHDPAAVHGLFIAGPNQQNRATEPKAYPILNPNIPSYLLADTTICGASLVIPWSTVDRGPSFGANEYDFTYLDTEAEKWTDHHKIVNFIVWGADESAANAFGGTVGSDGTITVAEGTPSTPDYVRTNPALETVSAASCPESDAWGTPLYWDPNYRTNWHAFQQALVTYLMNSAPYAADVGYIRFGIGGGGEDYPVDHFEPYSEEGRACWDAWQDAGLSATQWLRFSKEEIDHEGKLGSRLPLFVAINDFPDTSPAKLVPTGVAAEARLQGLGIGMEGMTTRQLTDCQTGAATYADWCALFADPRYHGQVPLELQTLTQSNPDSDVPGCVSCGPTGYLSPLLDGMIKSGAQVLEIWPQEWLVADDSTWRGNAGNASTYVSNQAPYAAALLQAACQVGGQGDAMRVGCSPPLPSSGHLP